MKQEALTRLGRFVRSAFVLALTLAPALAKDEPARPTQDGVYTAEQAERGQQGYKQSCAACHPLDWYKGGREADPCYRAFLEKMRLPR